MFLYGNDVLERNHTDDQGFMKTWIDPNRLLVSGVLSRYYLYANPSDRPGTEDDLPSPSVTRIQIWRPVTGEQSPGRPEYTLVWERRVLLNTTVFGLLYTVISFRYLVILSRTSCLMIVTFNDKSSVCSVDSRYTVLTLSPLSSHSMGSTDPELPGTTLFLTVFKMSKPIFRLYGNKSKTCRPVFRPYRVRVLRREFSPLTALQVLHWSCLNHLSLF